MARQPLKPFVPPSAAQPEPERPLPPSLWPADTGPVLAQGQDLPVGQRELPGESQGFLPFPQSDVHVFFSVLQTLPQAVLHYGG